METPAAGKMHVVYKWKSIYEFSPELVKELRGSKELKSVKCEFDPVGQTFTLDGLQDDTEKALEALKRSVQKAFDNSIIKKRVSGYIPQIRRSILSQFNHTPITWKEVVTEDEGVKELKDPASIDSFNYTLAMTWTPKTESDFVRMLHPQDAEADVPIMIARVCDCMIKVDSFEKKLTIHANDHDVIATVVRKLDTIERNFTIMLYPTTVHLVHVEDKQDFRLKLVSLYNQRSTIGRTTLLGEKIKKYYADRKSIYSLRLLRPKSSDQEKLAVVPLSQIKHIPGDRMVDGPRAWRDYKFKGWGNLGNDPEIYVKPRTQQIGTTVNWGMNIQRHAEELSSALELLPSSLRAEVFETDDFLLGPPPVVGEDTPSGDIKLGPRPTFAPRETEVQPNALPVVSTRRVRGIATNSTTASNKAAEQPVPKPQEQPLFPSESKPAEPQDDILPPPPVASAPTPGTQGMVRATRRLRVPNEKKQEVSEPDTREMRNVGQQKGPTKQKKAKEQPYNPREHTSLSMQRMYEAFQPGFDYARLNKCKIAFEARFGRVLYNNWTKATDCMTWEDLGRVLDDKKDKLKVLFTDRVTTDPVDADYVCDLKSGPQENMFNYDADKKTIWYEFLCDHRGKPCIVKFNAETTEMEVLGKLETYTTVYWNCPMRCWDARFTLQARKILNHEELAFRSLAESLYVADQTALPDLSFRTECNDLIVKKVFCKRETRYITLPTRLTGPNRNFELCVTEVQDLWIQGHTDDDEAFKAIATERENMINNERLYYTFSIIPTKEEEILKSQATLEVGEVAQWTSETILGTQGDGVLEPLTKIVNAVVKRIDDVGYNNQGAWQDSSS